MKDKRRIRPLEHIELLYETDQDLLFLIAYIPKELSWTNVKVYKVFENGSMSFDIFSVVDKAKDEPFDAKYCASFKQEGEALLYACTLAVTANKIFPTHAIKTWINNLPLSVESTKEGHTNGSSS